jgi:hypothetical protein
MVSPLFSFFRVSYLVYTSKYADCLEETKLLEIVGENLHKLGVAK